MEPAKFGHNFREQSASKIRVLIRFYFILNAEPEIKILKVIA
jgi:hypothetical protein